MLPFFCCCLMLAVLNVHWAIFAPRALLVLFPTVLPSLPAMTVTVGVAGVALVAMTSSVAPAVTVNGNNPHNFISDAERGT
jgi:hypothetical protein